MKIARYLLIAASSVTALAAIAWFLRDSLIQRISNPLLQEYGIAVTSVSLDALATDNATIGRLRLVHDKGTSIDIEGLSLPIGTAAGEAKIYRAEKVSVITATRTEGEPFEIANLIEQVLSLHGNLGDSTFIVDEFSLPPYRRVHDLQWIISNDRQMFEASVDSIDLSVAIRHLDASNTLIELALPEGSLSANLQHREQGLSLIGETLLDLPTWAPVGKLVGIIPTDIELRSGSAELTFDIDLPYATSESPSLTAELTPTTKLQLTRSGAPDSTNSITVKSSSSVAISATFPAVHWSLRLAETSLLLSDGEWRDIPLTIVDLSCQSGPQCSASAAIAMEAVTLPAGKVDRLRFAAVAASTSDDENLCIEIQPGATLEVTALDDTDISIGQLAARLESNATLEVSESGWQLTAEALDASVGALSLTDKLSVSSAVFLQDLSIGETDERLSATLNLLSPASEAVYDRRTIRLPGVTGGVSLRDDRFAADLQTVELQHNGAINARHNIRTSSGQLSIDNVAISFANNKLSKRISPLPGDWDITAGDVFISLDTAWTKLTPTPHYNGNLTARLDRLAGYYRDTAFVGFSTRFDARFDNEADVVAKPSSLTVELLETGLEVSDISASYSLNADLLGIDVQNLMMSAFDGRIQADPFSFRTDRNVNTLVLNAASLQLEALLTLKEFEAINVTGSVSAKLPITVTGDTVTIVDGMLEGEAPGGVIRYLPGLDVDATDTSGLALATRALSNFKYESLTSELNYSSAGDLLLKLQLTGRNPDLDENRPVVLNLGVESNIPEMLKSLRAARAVEEILEKELAH